MAHRLLNSASDPQRILRALRLSHCLQQGLQMCLERIWTVDTVIDLAHAHGRALGLATGLGLVNAITPAQFNLLAEAFTQAFEDRPGGVSRLRVTVRKGDAITLPAALCELGAAELREVAKRYCAQHITYFRAGL